MFNIGIVDLVKRTKAVSVAEYDYEWVDFEFPNDEIGIVIDLEEPIEQSKSLGIEEIVCFVRVMWQNSEFGTAWHLSDELILLKKANNT